MNKIPGWAKIIFGIASLVFSIVLYDKISDIAELIMAFGADMSDLRSQSGNSVAEHYYQLHGLIYACFGRIIEVISWVIPFMGIAIVFASIYPVIKDNKNKIKNKMNAIKNTTQQVVQIVSQDTEKMPAPASAPTSAPASAPAPAHTTACSSENVFCKKCGAKISAGMDFCTHCGNKIIE